MKTQTLSLGFSALILLSAGLTTCHSEPQEVTQTQYTLNDFTVKEIPATKGTSISPSSMHLCSPGKMCLVHDNILTIKDSRLTDNAIWLLNVKDKTYSKALTIGNGPTEVNELKYIWNTGNTLHGCDKTGKVLTIVVNPSDLSTTISKEAQLDVNLQALCPMSNGCYLTCGKIDRYHIVDCRDTLLGKTGVFPVNEVPSGHEISNMHFYVDMKSSPDRDHIVCANNHWNKIEIYDGEGNLKHWLSGPIDVTSDIVSHQVPNTPICYVMLEPNYTFFTSVHTSDKGFMVSYDGKEFIPRSGIKDYGHNYILTFDWEGKPQNLYHFEQPFWNFAYDDKTKTFYMIIEKEDEYKVIKYAGVS